MIAHLRGKLAEKQPNLVVVDVDGVGYELTIPVSTYLQLGNAGEEVALHTHTHVREDSLALFGFATRHEKSIFEKLITVSGIGPRLAVTVLSGLPAGDLATAIRNGDVATLTRIPGVGRKTGERMVLELREKLIPAGEDEGGAGLPSGMSPIERDVISALLNLGCPRPAAEKAVRNALNESDSGGFEPLFRRSLELMGR